MAEPGSSFEQYLLAFDGVLGPNIAFFNAYRSLVFITFLVVGFVAKTVLTVGFSEAVKMFLETSPEKYVDMLTDDTFLLESITRVIITAIMTTAVLSLIGFASGSPSFTFGRSRKRRRRRTIEKFVIQQDYEVELSKILDKLKYKYL